jgi:hypothetical protein
LAINGLAKALGCGYLGRIIDMTPVELYEWAKDNKCEDMDMVFVVGVGNEEIELDIDGIARPARNFNIYISLV